MSGKKSPLVSRVNDRPAFPGEELVMVPSPFFSHRLTKGYDSPTLHVVAKVNDVPVKNLAHLVEILHDSKDEFLEFRFAETEVETLVFRRQEMLDATEDILTDNGIRKQYSDDLDALLEEVIRAVRRRRDAYYGDAPPDARRQDLPGGTSHRSRLQTRASRITPFDEVAFPARACSGRFASRPDRNRRSRSTRVANRRREGLLCGFPLAP